MEKTLETQMQEAFSKWAKTGFSDETLEKEYEVLTKEYEKTLVTKLEEDSPSCSLDDDECLSCGS